jgi:hypothetical protein
MLIAGVCLPDKPGPVGCASWTSCIEKRLARTFFFEPCRLHANMPLHWVINSTTLTKRRRKHSERPGQTRYRPCSGVASREGQWRDSARWWERHGSRQRTCSFLLGPFCSRVFTVYRTRKGPHEGVFEFFKKVCRLLNNLSKGPYYTKHAEAD